MFANFRRTYRVSEEYSRFALFALFTTIILSIVASVFLSPALVFALLVSVIVLVITFFKPEWSLAGLLFYLPFEPFLLKWIPDNIHVFARYASEIMIYLLVIVVLWKLVSKQIEVQSTKIDVPFILFLSLILISVVVNVVYPVTAILGTRMLIRFILLFFVTVYIAPSQNWMRATLIWLFTILGIQAFLGFAQILFGGSVDSFLLPTEGRAFGEITLTSGTVQFWDPGQRVFGTLGRYDRLGVFMAFVMLLLSAVLFEKNSWTKYRTHFMVLLLVALPVLAFTYSRSAWFGFVLGFLFIALWAYREKRVAYATGAVILVMTLYLAFSGLVVSRLIDVSDQSLSDRFFEAFSLSRWRGEYYGLGRTFWIVQTVTTVVPASPLFGHGPASYGGGAVSALHNTKMYDELGLPFGVYGTDGYIDNNWFSIWGELGTVGLVVFLWMYFVLFITCVRVWQKSKDPFVRAFAIGTASCMIAFALNAFLGTFFEVRTLAPYVWVSAGCVIVLGKRENILE